MLTVVLSALAGAAPPAAAQDLRGFFTTTYGSTTATNSGGGSPETKTEFTFDRETLDLNFNKTVTPFLGYRLILRSERTDAITTTNDNHLHTNDRLVQPAADFTLASPGYSLNAGIRFREVFSEGGQFHYNQLDERNYFSRFFFTQPGLPIASLTYDRTTSVDEEHTRDTADTRYQLQLQHTVGDANGTYSFAHHVNDDNIAERTRIDDVHLGTLGYSSRWFRDHLAVQASTTVTQTTTTEEFNRTGPVVINQALARGLRADQDLTPLDTSDACAPGVVTCPVVTAPGLAAGGGNVPLLVNVSVGFELTMRASIGEMEITVAPEPPAVLPINLGAITTFRVFATDDATLVHWTEVLGVSQVYDATLQKFTLTFPSTTSRFFKAYASRSDFGASVKATGISSGFTTNVTSGNQRVTKNLTGSVSAGLVFTPLRWLTATYNVTLSGNRQENPDTNPATITNTSGTHAGTLTLTPHRLLTVTGTAQYSYTDSDQRDFQPTTSTSYILTLGSSPLPTLTTTATAARTENTLGGSLENRVDSVNFTVAARVLPRLTADSTLSGARTEDFVQHQTTTNEGFALNLNGQVLPRVNTVFNYSVQRQEISPVLLNQEPVTVTHQIGGGTTYTLSRVVNFTTRFDYLISDFVTTFSQNYKLDWVPTEKMSVFVNYRHSSETVSRSATVGQGTAGSSESIAGNIRWTLSRFMDLSANASYTRATTGDSIQTVQSYTLSANFRF